MSRMLAKSMLLATLAIALVSPALGDDWVAVKLRGTVLTLVEGSWVKLERGAVVPDDRVIRTLRTGRVVLVRGKESIELGGETQVQIFDRTASQFTTVKQYFGTVGVEADVRHVQHFAVQTPYLAAVVKGTRFVVTSDADGARVDVSRGQVAVRDADTRQSTLVVAGQSAETSEGTPLSVSGEGKLPDVRDGAGQVVASSGGSSGASGSGQSSNAGGNGNGNAGGNGNGNSGGNGNENGNSGQGGGNEGSNAGGNGRGNAYGLSKRDDD